jgi:glycerol-3-phosphate dehydrogenase
MLETQKDLTHWVPIAAPFENWHDSLAPLGHWLFGYFPILALAVFKVYNALSAFYCPHSYILTKTQAEIVFPQLQTQRFSDDECVDSHLKYCAVFYEGMHNDA